jgi:chromosome partitioning protein
MSFVIVIAHQKGGVGKSTIASNLAVELSKNQQVSVIDLDMQKSISYFNSVRSESKNPLEIKYVSTFDELQKLVNQNTKTLIIDVGGFDSDLNRAAMLGADVLITPVSDSVIEIVGLLSFKNILNEVRKVRPDIRASILLNRIHASARISVEKLKDFIGQNHEFKLLNSVLRDRVEFKKAFENGVSVNEFNPKSKAATEITDLIKEIQNGKN